MEKPMRGRIGAVGKPTCVRAGGPLLVGVTALPNIGRATWKTRDAWGEYDASLCVRFL